MITECEDTIFEVEVFNYFLDGGEGVIRLLLLIMPFLGLKVECILLLHNSDYDLKRVI